MKSVRIPFSEHLVFGDVACLKIDSYKWLKNDYKPVVDVYLCHNDEVLKVKFVAFESEISCNEQHDNGRVYCDSCVEFFVQPFPDDSRYINFEINPIGAMIMSIGKDRNDRTPLVFEYKNKLNLKTEICEGFWSVEFEIPFTMLREIYDENLSEPIKKMYGNFYKCGDETREKHYGMWNEVDEKEPDFHQPKYFGELILE